MRAGTKAEHDQHQLSAPVSPGLPAPGGPNVGAYYDRFMYDGALDEYFAHSGFHNFGIWREGIDSPNDACRALVAELVALAPAQPARVLEVGCGKGATTRELRTRWPGAEITAIDISEIQLETCREKCRDVSFLLMDACDLTFDDASFDIVISIEAAFHFPSRRRFLERALRVLAPNGCLLLQDVLYGEQDPRVRLVPDQRRIMLDRAALIPPANHLSGLQEYEDLLRDVGFGQCRIADVTDRGPRRFYQHFQAHFADRRKCAGYDQEHIRVLRIGARIFARELSHCLLVSAQPLR